MVDVIDSGKGIPEDKLEAIFRPFEQVNALDKGTGLGLTLTKKMCEDMGIELTVFSTVGVGSTFSLKIKKDFRNG